MRPDREWDGLGGHSGRGGRTVLAAVAAWVVYRLAKRALKVALLAGVLAAGAGLAKSRGVDLSAVQRFATCQVPALIRGAGQLPQLLGQRAPGTGHRLLPVARQLARCQPPAGAQGRRR
jgi:hypothetical protein